MHSSALNSISLYGTILLGLNLSDSSNFSGSFGTGKSGEVV